MMHNVEISLFLLRHGEAFHCGEQGIETDEARFLTEEGRQKTVLAASLMKLLGCQPETIISSSLVRARETATIVASILTQASPIQIHDSISPDASPDRLMQHIKAKNFHSVLIVGHMPHLSRFISYCLDGSNSLMVTVKKSSLCKIIFTQNAAMGKGTLEWLLQPKQMRCFRIPPS